MRKVHSYSPRTRHITELLGTEIARGRRTRRFTQEELAERAGISVSTLRSVEQGSTAVAIGTVFELATLVGVELFADELQDLRTVRARSQDRLALLPSRVRQGRTVDDDF